MTSMNRTWSLCRDMFLFWSKGEEEKEEKEDKPIIWGMYLGGGGRST